VKQPGSAGATARCLIVDDDGTVRHALARAIQGHGLATLEAGSGVEALAILEREGEVPLCISDVHMAEMVGITFLREAINRYPDMAVIMLTGVADVSVAVECLQIGALDYLSKPVVMEEVRARVDKALEKRQLVLQNRFYQRNLEGRVRELDRRNKESLINGVQTLVHALEAKDAYTSGHSSRVARYAQKTAIHLGYIGELLQHIRLGAELHDIGKIGTREAILNKPGRLRPTSSSTSRSTARWVRRSWHHSSASLPWCSASCAPTTSGWTAAAFPTAWPATGSRARLASLRWWTPSTR
jgi:putative two-component system response regulator